MISNAYSGLKVAQLAGYTSTQMIMQNYGKFIKGEHLKIDRKIQLFSTDSVVSSPYVWSE